MTRTPAPETRPVGLSIAGSDAGGGAGIQADLKTMEAFGLFGTSAITAVTAQNTLGVESTEILPTSEVEAQIDAVVSDFDVAAAKTGMLATAPIVRTVTERLDGLDVPLVVDPVMVAASGDRLLQPEAEDAYESLIETATIVTPNADEAAVLTGIQPEDIESAIAAGEALLEMGVEAALVKGGHIPGETVTDVFVRDGGQPETEVFEHERVDTDATHGSGCTLSSAIVAGLAFGSPLSEAVETAVEFMERALRYHHDVGQGPGSVHHLAEIRERAARTRTAEAVQTVVEDYVERDVGRLVPEVGMNVVGATPYAEETDEVAAVEGRITQTMDGVAPNRGVRFGASSHMARFLLAAREHQSDLRFAVNCRLDSEVEAALQELDGAIGEFDRAEEPVAVKEVEGSTMQWGASQAFESADEPPVAVIDRGEVGKEKLVKLLATDPDILIERTATVLESLG